jgi:two-component system NtrC family sensor kinase
MSWIGEIPLPAMRLDMAGRVVEANRLAGKLLDRAAADLCGSTLAELRAASPQLPEPATTIPLADGGVAIFTEGGLVKGLQQQVYHLSRLASAGRLVAVVVHEINNALSGILGYAQFLLAQPVAAEARRDLARIHDEALRTARVAQNLLRFSRGGRGERAPVRVEELLARCAELKRRDLALRSIKLELDVDGTLPPIEADEALLSQVIINLLTNAQQSISAVRDHGHVTMRARATRRRIVIDVIDDGPGIPDHLKARVFEPFFTSRSDGSGTGLGLTLCREILHDHGGDVRIVERIPPGATLRISLPAGSMEPVPARPTPPPPDSELITGRRVVVVEDEPALREVLTRAFSGRGNHVITFEHGEDALPYLANEQVDLIVSDIHRPGLDGIQLYDQLAKLRPALLRRIIFVTGDALGAETADFLRRSRAETLRKPLKLDDLARAARRVVERASSQGELFQAAAPAADEAPPPSAESPDAPASAPSREEPREAEAT